MSSLLHTTHQSLTPPIKQLKQNGFLSSYGTAGLQNIPLKPASQKM